MDTCEKNDIVSDVITGNVLYKGEDIPVYFKAYAFSYPHIAKGDRGLLNEIIGYLVCHLHKVPQPEQAFFVLMPKEKLTHLWGNLNERIKKVMSLLILFLCLLHSEYTQNLWLLDIATVCML